MSIDRDQFDAKFASLRDRFRTRLAEYADRLDELLAGCPDSSDDIRDLIHRVAGTAGSFGFAEISAEASGLDESFALGGDPCDQHSALGDLATTMRGAAEPPAQ